MSRDGRKAPGAERVRRAERWFDSSGLVIAAIGALTLFVYAPGLGFAFTNWDDPTYVTENPRVQSGLSWSNAVWALTTTHSPYWHPLTWLSHMLDVELFGLDAGLHHLTSVLLHLLNAVLLYAVLRRLTGAGRPSAFVAGVFAVHPLHVESVAWVAERKDVLSTLFMLLAIAAYAGYVRTRRPVRYLATAGCFALALAAKPMVVTLPFVLLLLDVWPLQRVRFARASLEAWRRAVVEKLPLFAMAAAAAAATVAVQARVGAVAGLDVLSWQARLTNAIVSLCLYVWTSIWPAGLAAFYPMRAWSAWIVGGAVVALGTATALAVRSHARQPYVFVGWFWFVITVAPVLGLLQAGEQARADRFMYVPLVGLSIAAAWGLPALLRRWPAARGRLPVLAGAVVILLAIAARVQAASWSDSLTLWTRAARVTADNYRAHENLGQALRDRGAFEESLAHYRTALALAPPGWTAYRAVIHNAMGVVLARQARHDAAGEQFAQAITLDPRLAEAHTNLGNARAAAREFASAAEHYRQAIDLDPSRSEPYVGLGAVLLTQGQGADAIPHYEAALRMAPALAEAHNGLGAALAMAGRTDAAMREYEEALRLAPRLATAHYNLAVLLARQGRRAEARARAAQAISIDPGYAPARSLLDRLDGRDE